MCSIYQLYNWLYVFSLIQVILYCFLSWVLKDPAFILKVGIFLLLKHLIFLDLGANYYWFLMGLCLSARIKAESPSHTGNIILLFFFSISPSVFSVHEMIILLYYCQVIIPFLFYFLLNFEGFFYVNDWISFLSLILLLGWFCWLLFYLMWICFVTIF